MTAEQTAPSGVAAMTTMPTRPDEAADANLRERLGEFRALMVISLLMTESVNEDQILELAASSAPGLGPCRIEGYGFSDGQWRAVGPTVPGISTSDIARQLAKLDKSGGKVDLPGRRWAWAYPLRGVSGLL